MMKKFKLLAFSLAMIAAAGFISCASDDESSGSSGGSGSSTYTMAQLAGTWSETYEKGYSDTLILKADGTGTDYEGGTSNEKVNITWTLSGNTVTITEPDGTVAIGTVTSATTMTMKVTNVWIGTLTGTATKTSNNTGSNSNGGSKSSTTVTTWKGQSVATTYFYFYTDNTYKIVEDYSSFEIPTSEVDHTGTYTGDTTKSGEKITMTPTGKGEGTGIGASTVSQWLESGETITPSIYEIDSNGKTMSQTQSFSVGNVSASQPESLTKQ